MNDEYLDLTIRDRDQTLFIGKVVSVTSYNKKGKFDVLLQHTNFISQVQDFIEFVDLQGEGHKMKFTNGIIRVHKNNVKVYLGVGEL